jgi:hypothetical protein
MHKPPRKRDDHVRNVAYYVSPDFRHQEATETGAPTEGEFEEGVRRDGISVNDDGGSGN